MSHIVIVVPCYNEARRLQPDEFRGFRPPGEHRLTFLFVNDGSRDATLEVLRALHEERPDRCQVLDLPQNSGKAEAVRQGVARAMTSGMDAVGYWDADLATPLEAIPCFQDVLRRKAEVSIVLGCRLPLLGHFVERGWLRQRLGRVFALCASWVLGQPIYGRRRKRGDADRRQEHDGARTGPTEGFGDLSARKHRVVA